MTFVVFKYLINSECSTFHDYILGIRYSIKFQQRVRIIFNSGGNIYNKLKMQIYCNKFLANLKIQIIVGLEPDTTLKITIKTLRIII